MHIYASIPQHILKKKHFIENFNVQQRLKITEH